MLNSYKLSSQSVVLVRIPSSHASNANRASFIAHSWDSFLKNYLQCVSTLSESLFTCPCAAQMAHYGPPPRPTPARYRQSGTEQVVPPIKSPVWELISSPDSGATTQTKVHKHPPGPSPLMGQKPTDHLNKNCTDAYPTGII